MEDKDLQLNSAVQVVDSCVAATVGNREQRKVIENSWATVVQTLTDQTHEIDTSYNELSARDTKIDKLVSDEEKLRAKIAELEKVITSKDDTIKEYTNKIASWDKKKKKSSASEGEPNEA